MQWAKAAGRRLAVCQDRLLQLDDSGPVAVVSPGYGETKRDYITLGYYLASNGFRVIR